MEMIILDLRGYGGCRGQKHYSERTVWHSTQCSVHTTALYSIYPIEPRPNNLSKLRFSTLPARVRKSVWLKFS